MLIDGISTAERRELPADSSPSLSVPFFTKVYDGFFD